MSIYKLESDSYESFTIITNPTRHFITSTLGATGSVYVYARRSGVEKDALTKPAFVDSTQSDVSIEDLLATAQDIGTVANDPTTRNDQTLANYQKAVSQYLDSAAELSVSEASQKLLTINRFTPSVNFGYNTLRKLLIKNQLSSYHKVAYPSAHWGYTNYNCLSLFSSPTVPTSSVLLYPNVDAGTQIHDGYVSGSYTPSGSFSFDFYINPRYNGERDVAFKAGTIMHLTSCFALSLVSGSMTDGSGRPQGFRLQLQLSHSADIPPSVAVAGTYPNDLIFTSDDNSLTHNNWHHVVVRWGTNTINDGTGSFNIDGVDKGYFVVPSGTISPKLFDGSRAGPEVLCVGNYYEGANVGTRALAYFFANDPSRRDGLIQMINDVGGIDEPQFHKFNHVMNADVHDLMLRHKYVTDSEIAASASKGPSSIIGNDIAFYLPLFFVADSPVRRYVGSYGGILQTPFFEIDGTTNDPFNVALSFGVNGHLINLENYVKDFATGRYPRLHHMSASAITTTTDALEANFFLYDQSFVRRRNTCVMPCDDGKFVPNFDLLKSEKNRISYVGDDDVEDLTIVNVDQLLSTSSFLLGTETDNVDDYHDQLVGFTPENPSASPGPAFMKYKRDVEALIASGVLNYTSEVYDPGVQMNAPLTIYQRTKDSSSNQVTFFDVSSIFYGSRIKPGSVKIIDNSLTGSGGVMSITLQDDENGGLYRADSLTEHAKWAFLGTVFYDEGVIAIKNPHLYFFGKDGYEISFKGEQPINITSYELVAPANQLNSSSNVNYLPLSSSFEPHDTDTQYVNITGINFHDDNYNVIMKARLATPIQKTVGSRVVFRVKMDW